MSMAQWYFMVSLLLGIFAAGFLFIGMCGIVTRRPLLISGRVAYVFNVLVLFVFLCVSAPSGIPLWGIFGPFVLFLIVVLVKGSSMKPRFAIFGVTRDSFQAALLVSLTRLNLPCEETPTGWWLPAIVDTLEVTAYPLGGRVVRMRSGNADGVLQNIAKELTDYYRSSASAEANIYQFIWYLFFAGIFAAVALDLTFGKVL